MCLRRKSRMTIVASPSNCRRLRQIDMRLLAIALVTVFAPLAIAQRTIPHAGHLRGHHSAASPLTSFLTPLLGDSFNPEDLSLAGDPSAQGPAFLLDATRSLSGSGGFPGQPDRTQPSPPSAS